MANKVVNAEEGTMLDEVVTNKALEIRPSPSNSHSLRLAPLNLLLLPWLQLLTPSSSGTLCPPPSLFYLRYLHHST